jgi:hypothetical protein
MRFTNVKETLRNSDNVSGFYHVFFSLSLWFRGNQWSLLWQIEQAVEKLEMNLQFGKWIGNWGIAKQLVWLYEMRAGDGFINIKIKSSLLQTINV